MRGSEHGIMGTARRNPTLLAGMGLCALMSVGCRGDDEAGTKGAAPSKAQAPELQLPPEVVPLSIEDPEAYYSPARGWIELVPPLSLPSNEASVDQVAIMLRLPDDAAIRVVDGPPSAGTAPAPAPTLAWPPGTELDRLEWVGTGEKRSLADIRGTRIDAEGKAFDHTLRRTQLRANAPMTGFEWPQGDASAHAAATEALVATMRTHPPAANMKSAKAKDRYLAGIASKNECGRCHVPLRPQNQAPNQHGLVDRGTDANGFFTPATAFAELIPLERYGQHDRNIGREFVGFACSADAEPRTHRPLLEEKNKGKRADGGELRGPRRVVCDRGVPLGHLDVRAAVAAKDPRALAVCATRRALFEHLDVAGRARFADAMAACEAESATLRPDEK